eukprot:3066357-Rhodomonas_salina.2
MPVLCLPGAYVTAVLLPAVQYKVQSYFSDPMRGTACIVATAITLLRPYAWYCPHCGYGNPIL